MKMFIKTHNSRDYNFREANAKAYYSTAEL